MVSVALAAPGENKNKRSLVRGYDPALPLTSESTLSCYVHSGCGIRPTTWVLQLSANFDSGENTLPTTSKTPTAGSRVEPRPCDPSSPIQSPPIRPNDRRSL